jgi:hypothetical protein
MSGRSVGFSGVTWWEVLGWNQWPLPHEAIHRKITFAATGAAGDGEQDESSDDSRRVARGNIGQCRRWSKERSRWPRERHQQRAASRRIAISRLLRLVLLVICIHSLGWSPCPCSNESYAPYSPPTHVAEAIVGRQCSKQQHPERSEHCFRPTLGVEMGDGDVLMITVQCIRWYQVISPRRFLAQSRYRHERRAFKVWMLSLCQRAKCRWSGRPFDGRRPRVARFLPFFLHPSQKVSSRRGASRRGRRGPKTWPYSKATIIIIGP